ncbi:MAG: hypothetical protein AAFP00_14175, partial [Bacteroidota bacterium]
RYQFSIRFPRSGWTAWSQSAGRWWCQQHRFIRIFYGCDHAVHPDRGNRIENWYRQRKYWH